MSRKETFFLTLICVHFVLTAWMIIPAGYHWGGDFAMYLQHARNILQGHPYTDLRYVINPHHIIAPRAYPPFYPIFLSLLIRFTGLNLEAIARANIFISTIALIWIYFNLRNRQPYIRRLLIFVAIALNPVFRVFSHQILSEPLFMVWLYCFFWIADHPPRSSPILSLLWNLLVGLLMALIIQTRTVGILIVPAFLIGQYIHRRLFQTTTWMPLLVVLICILWTMPAKNSWLDYILYAMQRLSFIGSHFVNCLLLIYHYYTPFVLPSVWKVLTATWIWGLVTLGWIQTWKTQRKIKDVFFVFYLFLFFFYPFQHEQLRFLYPVFPLIVEYFAVGLTWILQRTSLRIGLRIFVLFLGIALPLMIDLLASYGFIQEYPNSITSPETHRMFHMMRRIVPSNGVVIASKPRVVTLFTNRRAGVYHKPHKDIDLIHYFCQNAVTHILSRDFSHDDRNFLIPFLERQPHAFKPIYSSGPLILWRFERSHECEPSTFSLIKPTEE